MKLIRNNPNGGREIRENSFPLHQDTSGNFGFLLGYVDKNTINGDKIIIPIPLAQEFASQFNYGVEDFHQRFSEGKPKKNFRQRTIEFLGGKVVDN